VSRISSDANVSEDGLMAMKKDLTKAASLFPEKLRFGAVEDAFTSASSVFGSDIVPKIIKKGCNAAQVCNPMSLLIKACKYEKINNLLFLTPYVTDVSKILIEEVYSHGINTSVTGTFN